MFLKINKISLFWITALLFSACQSDPKSTPQSQQQPTTAVTDQAPAPGPAAVPEPPFVKEGELAVLDPGGKKIVQKFDIEIAQIPDERQQGLMYRKSMLDKQGMLFLFEYPEPQSFWMHNTYISLDIIYLNEKMEVVSIQKNAAPQSDKPLPSGKPAQYVLEINGGLSDKLGIKPGMKVAWQDYVNNREVGGYNSL
ncbi:MAG: DUF192 domain-containing protein [Saprospiraceae bacterium]|nr:DUF192 domain-containing protein [Saprospiraceae bacterium]